MVAPGELVDDVSRVQIYNGLVPSGFAQIKRAPRSARPTRTLPPRTQRCSGGATRRSASSTASPVVRPAGAWSLLLDVAALGLDCVEVSDRLLGQKVAATPMRGWGGEIADRHVRFVFSNEPVGRLALLGDRVRRALAVADDRT